jgi:hypothetical protein
MHTKSVMHHNSLNILGIDVLKDFLAGINAALFCAIHFKRYIYVTISTNINVGPPADPIGLPAYDWRQPIATI